MKPMVSLIRPLLPSHLVCWLQHRSFVAKTGGLRLPPALSAAVSATAHRKLSGEEMTAIRRIEALRRDLLRSQEPLKVMGRGVDKETTIGDVCKRGSKSPVWALLLFVIVRVCKPRSCLEMGTSLGLSAAYIGSALKLNGRGKLITLEGAPAVASVARRNLENLGLTDVKVRVGLFNDTLGPTLKEFGPFDFVFIDGHHDEMATKEYFEHIRSHVSPEAVLVFDDINWSDGMRRAWRYIADSTTQAYDLRDVGIWINA